ncbi:MAG TPA: TadE/TadG family type IV pilus assembly protein [Microlunatus sp.]|nr:TadE/TadG family type IV pilus assembly protein [Microlunatus sp.]
MAVEVVILVPVLLAVMMMVVAFGRYVDIRGQVEAVARDAVRAASLERDAASATLVAQAIADATVPDSTACQPVQLQGQAGPLLFAPGEIITVTLTCEVSFRGLGGIGLPGSLPVSGMSSAPLDHLRRTE